MSVGLVITNVVKVSEECLRHRGEELLEWTNSKQRPGLLNIWISKKKVRTWTVSFSLTLDTLKGEEGTGRKEREGGAKLSQRPVSIFWFVPMISTHTVIKKVVNENFIYYWVQYFSIFFKMNFCDFCSFILSMFVRKKL